MNYKIALSIFAVSIILVASVFVLAQPLERVVAETKAGNIVFVPAYAVKLAPGIFSLGSNTDIDGTVVEGFMFIDDRKANSHKPSHNPGEKGDKSGRDSSTCYSLFAKGAKWKTTEPYITSNEAGNEINLALTETSLNTWDSEVSFNIFGTGVSGVTDGADDVAPDGKNEVMFEDLGTTNTIAYTIVWGVFGGPPQGRKLVEWDAVFNSDYDWSETGEANKMDYQNIATHEFGHALGLGHPDSTCTEETMYAFASFGETKKQTLEAGDITGVNKLYS